MIVRKINEQNGGIELTSIEILTTLESIKVKKENEIEEITEKINKYEQKKRAEAAFYQSLSPVRKFFASRPPSHHQAVEYIVHVKERLKVIEKIKQQIIEIVYTMEQLRNDSTKSQLVLTKTIIEEIKIYRETEF